MKLGSSTSSTNGSLVSLNMNSNPFNFPPWFSSFLGMEFIEEEEPETARMRANSEPSFIPLVGGGLEGGGGEEK